MLLLACFDHEGRMKKEIGIIAVLGALLSTQVLAAGEKVCLLRNQLESWRVIDTNTLEMTDKRKNIYHVSFSSPCPEAAVSTATIVFGRAWRDLACLAPGLAVSVTAPGFAGRRVCTVASVTIR
jgi:hypothetical protein